MTRPNDHNTAHSHETDIPPVTAIALGDIGVRTAERTGPTHEAIKRLETAAIPLPMKIDALLVSLGEKPATLNRFTSREWAADGQPQHVQDTAVEEYVGAVKALGVDVEVIPDRVVNPWEEYTKGSDGDVIKSNTPDWQDKISRGDHQTWRTVLVARSPDNMDLIRAGNEKNDARLLGQAYGFPKTATEAYLEGRPIYPADIDETQTSTLAFARYGLSAEHASEELDTAKRWSEAVQRASPQLYAEMLDLVRGVTR